MRKTGKKTRLLPTRGGLNDVTKSKQTIADYAKASPISPTEPTATVIQNLAKTRV